MTEDSFAIVDKLSDVVQSIQKCLQCPICLERISSPIRTRCGHSFCDACIRIVLSNKKASCPLCNRSINRRSISKDKYTEECIENLEKLIEAIHKDTNIDILSHSKRVQSTREGWSPVNFVKYAKANRRIDQPNKDKVSNHEKRDAQNESTRDASGEKHLDESHEKCKPTAVPNDAIIDEMLEVRPLFLEDNDNVDRERKKEEKVESWLKTLENTEVFDDPSDGTSMQEPSCLPDKVSKFSKYCISSPTSSEVDENLEELRDDKATDVNRHSARLDKEDKRKVKSFEEPSSKNITIRRKRRKSARSSETRNPNQELKYKAVHEKVRAKSNALMAKRKTTDVTDCDVASTSSPYLEKSSSRLDTTKRTWDSVVEFGKEMRTRKAGKTKKSLNVVVQNHRSSRPIEEADALESTSSTLIMKRRRSSSEEGGKLPSGNNKPPDNSLAFSTPDKDHRCNNEDRFDVNNSQERLRANLADVSADKGKEKKKYEKHKSFDSEPKFIMLNQGTKILIDELRDDQMNEIIGVNNADDRVTEQEDDKAASPKRSVSRNALSLKKQNTSDNCVASLKLSPLKFDNSSLFLLGRNEKVEDLDDHGSSSTELLSPSSRLSLKKNPDGSCRKSDGFLNASSGIAGVKRNLFKRKIQSDSNIVGTSETFRPSLYKAERNQENCKNDDSRSKEEKKLIVPFKKLGKIYKKRHRVKFYSLGSTIRESLIRTIRMAPSLDSSNYCHLIDSQESSKTTVAALKNNESTALTESKNKEEESHFSTSKREILISEKPKSDSTPRSPSNQQRKSFESLDTIFVSLSNKGSNLESIREQIVSKDQRENKANARNFLSDSSERRPSTNTNPKPKITSEIILLSPKNDSQLQFLSRDSLTPTASVPPCSGGNSTSKNIDNVSAMDSYHSDEKVGANNSAKSNRTRKRLFSDSPEEIVDSDAERAKDEKESGGDGDADVGLWSSRSSRMNARVPTGDRDDAKKPPTSMASSSLKPNLASSFGESESIAKEDGRVRGNGKTYKRIKSVCSSDSDTQWLDMERKKQSSGGQNYPMDIRNPGNSKRKRASFSDDFDDEIDVKEIVSNWCNDVCVSSSQRSSKRGKVHSSGNAPRASDRVKVSSMFSEKALGVTNDSWIDERLSRKQPPEDAQDRCNDDILRQVREIQKANKVDVDDQIDMDDNFDEAIANVDTDLLKDSFPMSGFHTMDFDSIPVRNRGSQPASKMCEKLREIPRLLSSGKNISEIRNEDATDKREQRYDRSGSTAGSDKENTIAKSQTSNSSQRRRRRSVTGDATATMGNVADGNLVRSNSLRDSQPKSEISSRSMIAKEVDSKDSAFDHDSLMNVTQDQLLFKALEEDLFGIGSSRGPRKSSIGDALPSRNKRSGDALDTLDKNNCDTKEETSLRAQEIECSDDENDIVESTPDKAQSENKTTWNKANPRQVTATSQTTLTSRRRRNESPVESASPASQISARNSLCAFTNNIDMCPLYESTPKSKQSKKGWKVRASRASSVRRAKDGAETRFCFLWSNLSIQEVESIVRLARLTNVTCVKEFCPDVTHVIVKADERTNAAEKTLKFMQGIAHRKFVVSFKWIVDCLKEGSFLNEEPYEAVDNCNLEPGPAKSRLRTEDLFERFAFLCVEPYRHISKSQYQDVLKATGATIVDRLDELAKITNKYKIILLQSSVHDGQVVVKWHNRTNAVPLSCDWIIECISRYEIISFGAFLQVILPEDALRLGYPQEFVETEDFENASDSSTVR